mgnify:FL=1
MALACLAAPLMLLFGLEQYVALTFWGAEFATATWAWPLVFLAGVVLLFAMLHLARGVAILHGHMAKHLLVKSGRRD